MDMKDSYDRNDGDGDGNGNGYEAAEVDVVEEPADGRRADDENGMQLADNCDANGYEHAGGVIEEIKVDDDEKHNDAGDGNDDGIRNILDNLDVTRITPRRENECLKRLKKELDEYERLMDILLGSGWYKMTDGTCILAKRIMQCLMNKVYMHFYAFWFPENGDVRNGYEACLNAYITGWGILMNEIVKRNVKKK